jgi:hypothetical protein
VGDKIINEANWLTCTNACRMADRIAGYWAERGYAIKIGVEKIMQDNPNVEPIWQIRSDMVNGLPRGYSSRGPDGGRLRRL